MGWVMAQFEDVKGRMLPGDVIAFGGRSLFSGIIRWAKRGPVSHVGVMLDVRAESETEKTVRMIEATSTTDDIKGVAIRGVKERLNSIRGELWWLPLGEEVRKKLNVPTFQALLMEQTGKSFDPGQAAKAATDTTDHVPILKEATHNEEDFSRFFCSELVTAALEKAGALPSLNCSEVTPMDICRFTIFNGSYYQLKGVRKTIRGYNTVNPKGWGE